MTDLIKPQATFCKGYKYQLRDDFSILLKIVIETDIHTELVQLVKTGNPEWPARLFIKRYFAWDGCSGCTIDDEYNCIPCLVHDALAYLMRVGGLDPKKYTLIANDELKRLLVLYRDTCFGRIRANYYHWGTDASGGAWARRPRVVYTYPTTREGEAV